MYHAFWNNNIVVVLLYFNVKGGFCMQVIFQQKSRITQTGAQTNWHFGGCKDKLQAFSKIIHYTQSQ